MKDELIINGKKYVHTPEVKEDRLVFFIKSAGNYFYADLEVDMQKDKKYLCKTVELKKGEIVVSEDDVKKAWDNCVTSSNHYELFVKLLGFKKDGV